MANAGLGIVIALGIGIAATLAVMLFRQSFTQSYEYDSEQRQGRPRDYNQPNSWSQTTNRRKVRQKNRKRNGTASGEKESVCTICMIMIEENEELISLPCSHEFHKQCIINWQKESSTCPNCRSDF